MKKILNRIGVGMIIASPALALAQGSLTGAASKVQEVIRIVTQIVVALAFIYFLWGLMQYLITDKKEEARSAMIYSALIMAVMFSIWGIIGLLQQTFGLQDTSSNVIVTPTVAP